MRRLFVLAVLTTGMGFAACAETDESGGGNLGGADASLDVGRADVVTASDSSPGADSSITDASVVDAKDGAFDSASNDAADADAADSAVVVPPGLVDPIGYTSFADSPFKNVSLPSYNHFEDWEDGLYNTPGVTSSSNQLGSAYGASLIDSVDGDDGAIDGKCQKDGGTCNSAFASGTISFTFDPADAGVLAGGLPTHVGIAWTDGGSGCDAIFEAYDAANVLIGTKTATAVGDGSYSGSVVEDRWFGVVHPAGVKKIIVKSSSGGVEVDHLHYGR